MKKIFKNINWYVNKNKYFFYIIPLIIYVNVTLIDTTTTFFNDKFSMYKSLIKYVCIAIIAIKIICCDLRNYKRSNYIRMSIILLVFILSSYFSTNRAIIQYFFIILGVHDLDFKRIVKYIMIGEGLCVLFIIMLALLNLIPNRVFGRSNSKVQRYSLGFQYATYPALFIWYFTMLYLYLKQNKIKIYEYIILLTINVTMYIVTDSRNELIFSILVISVSIAYNKMKMPKVKKIVNFFAQYSIITFSVISILLMNLYNPDDNTWKKIDSFVSGRLKYSYKCKQKYDVKLFGNDMEWIGLSDIYEGKYKESEFFYIDNSYLNILYNYGIVFLILVNFSYYYLIKKLVKKKNNFLVAILLLIIMHSFIDPQLIKIIYNIFILLFTEIIFDERKIIDLSWRKKELNEQNI